MPPEAHVLAEGCDCEDAAYSVALLMTGDVLVSRDTIHSVMNRLDVRRAADGTEEQERVPC
jgi:hypothetical protein